MSHLIHAKEFLEKEKYEKALIEINHALKELSVQETYVVSFIKALNVKGSILHRLRDTQQALEIIQQNKQLIDQVKKESPSKELEKEEAVLLSLKASIYEVMGELGNALPLYQQALSMQKRLDNKKEVSDILNSIGIIHAKKGNLDQALDFFSQGLELRKQLRLKDAIGSSLSNMGIIFKLKGNYDKALDYYQQALAISEEEGNKEAVGNFLNNIANLFRLKGELDQALPYYKRSLQLYREINNKERIALSLVNISSYYRHKGELTKALELTQESLRLHKELGNKQNIAHSLLSIGQIYYRKNEFRKALENLEQSLNYYKQLGNNLHTSWALCFLVIVALDSGTFSKAKHYLTKLEQITELEENNFIDLRYRFALASFLKSNKQQISQLTFQSLYEILNNLVTAQKIFGEIVDEEIIDGELTINAIFNLCELLLLELKILGTKSVLGELKALTTRLLDIGHSQKIHSLLAKTHILQAKLSLLNSDVNAAKALLKKARTIAEEKGYQRLATVIIREQKQIEGKLPEWLFEEETSILDRLGEIQLEGLLISLRRNRVEYYSHTSSKTVDIKELTQFANQLKKRKIGW